MPFLRQKHVKKPHFISMVPAVKSLDVSLSLFFDLGAKLTF